MRQQLKKALKLARKTNDAIIFFDAETPEDSFAIVDLDRYEKLVDLPDYFRLFLVDSQFALSVDVVSKEVVGVDFPSPLGHSFSYSPFPYI